MSCRGMTPRLVPLSAIAALREEYRASMGCQIVHDSIHARPGWTNEYLLEIDGEPAAYASVAVAGPWKRAHTLYEFFVTQPHRLRSFALFDALVAAGLADRIETQSNDPWLTPMLHTYCARAKAESILFEDTVTTHHAPPGAQVRAVRPEDAAEVQRNDLDADARWVLTRDGAVAGTGDILYHYNRPYGDVYMQIAEPQRRLGLGAFLVQELKRICREGGSVPAARCQVTNAASRRTLQRAGFTPCGNVLVGQL